MIKRAALLLLVLATASCSARTLREAQDHFNRGADLENQSRLQRTSSGVTLPAGAEAEYRAALLKIEAELSSHAGTLQAEGLWFTARLLKALCLWRIAALGAGTLDQIVKARAEVASLTADTDAGRFTPGTRDRALVAALPGLLDHEMGLRTSDVPKAQSAFASADKTIEEALKAVNPPEDHEIRLYLRLSQMASLRERVRIAPDVAAKKAALVRFAEVKDQLKAAVDTNPAYAALKELGVALAQAAGGSW